MRQSVHIISMWFQEDWIEPLFRKHYELADDITIIEDAEPSMDDVSKASRLSEAANNSDADVRIVVDADEFVYPVAPVVVETGKIYSVGFWEVFRHKSEGAVNRLDYPLQQRTHGNPRRGECFGQGHFIKPIVFGRGVYVNLSPGNHNHAGDVVHGRFDGAHWAMADVEVAVRRRVTKRERMSQVNFNKGLTSHDWHITGEAIRLECAENTSNPKVIETERKRFEI